MPTVRYTGGGTYRTGGVTFENGDEHDLPEGLASHLVSDVGEFEYAEVTDVEYTEVDDSEDEAEDGSESEAEDESGSEEWADWTEEDWLSNGWASRKSDVNDGLVDNYLEEIIEIETSNQVREAAQERLNELEE